MNTNLPNIALIAGGYSGEMEVSLKSQKGILSFLEGAPFNVIPVLITRDEWVVLLEDGAERLQIDKNNFTFTTVAGQRIKFDYAYITIHGTPGEDGKLTGYFDMLGIPYSCCPTLTGALTANKYVCNRYLSSFGIRIAPSVRLQPTDHVRPIVLAVDPGLPAFVKPNDGGSSVATTKVTEIEGLAPAIALAFKEGAEVMVEHLIQGTEVTCGCYADAEGVHVLPVTEVVSHNEFFDFDAKYNGQVEEITPARISPEMTTQIQDLTREIYGHLNASGIIRVDFIIENDIPVLLEVNTTPGMTATSFIPQQIAAAGLNIGEVLTSIIHHQMDLHKKKRKS